MNITDEMFKKGKFWTDGPMVVTGCTKVSEGCKNCWSEKAHVMRQGRPAWPSDCLTDKQFNGKIHFRIEALERVLRGASKVIAPWNDLYHPDVTDKQIVQFFNTLYRHEWAKLRGKAPHTILIITKRLERAAGIINRLWITAFGETVLIDKGNKSAMALAESTMSKFWPGVVHISTMENQKMVDERMGDLLRIPGKRGIIIEPMLGAVNLSQCQSPAFCCHTEVYPSKKCIANRTFCLSKSLTGIHQVILGPENGKGKRPFKEEWAESVRLQCERAGVPFYRKDRGEGELAWR